MKAALSAWIDRRRFRKLRLRYERETGAPGILGQQGKVDWPEAFYYVHWNAWKLSRVGLATYRAEDALQRPNRQLSEDRVKRILDGCKELVAWKGLDPKLPLRGIAIQAFHDMLSAFHFRLESQAQIELSDGTLVDRMDMVHEMTGETLTLFSHF